MTDVFISYSKYDRTKAHTIAEVLVERGFDVWWDVELLPGQSFAEEIEAVINSANTVIVLWTSHSVNSQWVQSEAMIAQKQKKITPIWLEKIDLPLPFNTLHTLDLSTWSGRAKDLPIEIIEGSFGFTKGHSDLRNTPRSEEDVQRNLLKPALEAEYWTSVSNRKPQSIKEYKMYLQRYGKSGAFSELAKARIEHIR